MTKYKISSSSRQVGDKWEVAGVLSIYQNGDCEDLNLYPSEKFDSQEEADKSADALLSTIVKNKKFALVKMGQRIY